MKLQSPVEAPPYDQGC